MYGDMNPYTLRTENREGVTYYYVSFRDGRTILRETEVSREVYMIIDECRRHEKKQKNYFDRHIEHSDLTDETLSRRALVPPLTTEEVIAQEEAASALNTAIEELPEAQRRRFVLFFEIGLTYEQIAKIEGCKRQPVTRSIKRAKEKIRDLMNLSKK